MGYTDLLGSIMYTLPSSRPCRWVLLLIWYAPIVGGTSLAVKFSRRLAVGSLGAEEEQGRLRCAASAPPTP